MKERNGFVSNSSSSSFVIFGKQIDCKDAKKYEHVWFVGGEWGEGRDAFELDEPLKELFSKSYTEYGQLWAAAKASNGESDEFIKPEDLRMMADFGGVTINAFDRSYGNSYEYGGIEDVIDRYKVVPIEY